VFSLQVELVALLKNHAVAVLIRVATRPQFQDEWSYTTLLDSTEHLPGSCRGAVRRVRTRLCTHRRTSSHTLVP
uniref:hypothetical protein n=1 Tax=Rhodococcus qingshengii TaxID=334542 RepID=UPI001C4E06B6